MKKQIKSLLSVWIALAGLLAGCTDIMAPAGVEREAPAAGTGRVTIVISGTGERTILPQKPAFAKYVFSFESFKEPLQGGVPTAISNIAIDATGPAGKTIDVDLSPGNWIIKAQGIVSINGVNGIPNGEYTAAEDQYTVNVFSGKSYTIDFNLTAVQTIGKGVLAWNITIPNTAATAKMEILNVDGSSAGFTPVDVKTNPEGSIGITPGFYLLDLYLNGKLQIREALHVYSYRTNSVVYTLGG